MAKRKMPSTIVIGPHHYRVDLVHKPRDSGGDLWGSIDLSEQVLRLDDDLSAENLPVVLLHEILHGVSYMVGLEMDERTVGTLSRVLVDVGRRNNLGWLFEDVYKGAE